MPVGETYALCSHELIEMSLMGDELRTAICRCGMTFWMCRPGCPNHPEDGGAWHYGGVRPLSALWRELFLAPNTTKKNV